MICFDFNWILIKKYHFDWKKIKIRQKLKSDFNQNLNSPSDFKLDYTLRFVDPYSLSLQERDFFLNFGIYFTHKLNFTLPKGSIFTLKYI